MALNMGDRVLQESATTGTGSIVVSGSVAGYRTFAAGVVNGNDCYYCIVDTAGNWEVTNGTLSGGNTLTRAAVPLSCITPGAKFNFTAGTKQVFTVVPGDYLDGSIASSINAATLQGIALSGLKASLSLATTNTSNTFNTGTQVISTIDCNAGAIDGTTIGVTTASTGKFSTLEVTGFAKLDGTYNVGTIAGGGTANVHWNNGNRQKITLNGAGISVQFATDASGSAGLSLLLVHTVASTVTTWDPKIVWANGTAPFLSTSAGRVDIITMIYDNLVDKYYASMVKGFF